MVGSLAEQTRPTDRMSTPRDYPSRLLFVVGIGMISFLPLGARAFRALSSARRQNTKRRSGALVAMSTAASKGGPNLANMRENYVSEGIYENDMPDAPHILMSKWIDDACSCKEVIEPTAMCLATVGKDGKPSARFVLMKGYSERGVTWYTNYNSRKAKELQEVPHAAITFWWGALTRSVRFEGEVVRVSKEESDEYFSCRPTGSKIGAWVSDQSNPIGSREELDEQAKEVEVAFASEGDNVPRPPHWGGFRLRPTRVEFWEGKPSRLHDRIVYSLVPGDAADIRDGNGKQWAITRLQP